MKAATLEKKLGDVVAVQSGFAFKSSEYSDSGHFLIRIANVQDGYLNLEKPKYVSLDSKTKRFELQAGDILTSLTGNVGRVAKVEPEHLPAALNQRVARLVPKPEAGIDAQYLLRFLNSLRFSCFLKDRAHGAAQANVSPSVISEVPIPFPPLEEQQRIVKVLDAAFEGLARAHAHAEANLQNARELFESIKADALAYSASDREEVILSEVADITSGLVDPREDAYSDMLHLGAGNMITGSDELIDVKTAREEKLKSGKYLFDETTILYSKIRPYLRKAARPDFQGLCSADVYPLTPKPDKLDRDFLFHLLLGHDFTEYAISGSDRAGMPKVNRNHMFAYRFELPPIEAQMRIATVIDEAHISCSALVELANKKLQDLDDLRQSLLQKAFAGELT